jgi:hypothetical protein
MVRTSLSEKFVNINDDLLDLFVALFAAANTVREIVGLKSKFDLRAVSVINTGNLLEIVTINSILEKLLVRFPDLAIFEELRASSCCLGKFSGYTPIGSFQIKKLGLL